jgi:ferredoxin
MKRIAARAKKSPGSFDPESALPIGEAMTFTARTGLRDGAGHPVGGCLECPDAPCLRFTPAELSAPVGLEISKHTDDMVCPSAAITMERPGVPEIDPDVCLGCGICISRCPVRAISLDDQGRAAVREVAPDKKRPFAGSDAQFDAARSDAAVRITLSHDSGADLAGQALHALTALTARRSPGGRPRADTRRTAALLVRNAFLALGMPARLSVQGNNADPCEIAARLPDGGVVIGEIEYGGDGLDATRRAMAAVAIARSRLGVGVEHARPVVVILGLPNGRTDVYRLTDDLDQILDVKVCLLPMASLLSAVLASDPDALATLLEPGSPGTEEDRMDQPAEAFNTAFGPTAESILMSAGIAPAKRRRPDPDSEEGGGP